MMALVKENFPDPLQTSAELETICSEHCFCCIFDCPINQNYFHTFFSVKNIAQQVSCLEAEAFLNSLELMKHGAIKTEEKPLSNKRLYQILPHILSTCVEGTIFLKLFFLSVKST